MKVVITFEVDDSSDFPALKYSLGVTIMDELVDRDDNRVPVINLDIDREESE